MIMSGHDDYVLQLSGAGFYVVREQPARDDYSAEVM